MCLLGGLQPYQMTEGEATVRARQARYRFQTWGRRFDGRAGCTSLRGAVGSPLSGPVSSGITHVGPALRLPHHAAGNLPVLCVDSLAASGKSAMASTLSKAERLKRHVANDPKRSRPVRKSAGSMSDDTQ